MMTFYNKQQYVRVERSAALGGEKWSKIKVGLAIKAVRAIAQEAAAAAAVAARD